MFKLSSEIEGKYMSEILLKFIKGFIFVTFKIKIEKFIYYSFFYWKKMLGLMPLVCAAIAKLRPSIGFYLFFSFWIL